MQEQALASLRPGAGSPTDINHLAYDAKDGPLLRIWYINILLRVVTLGIYGFWGKARLRRYVIGGFSLLGDRFEYTGTGGQLFKGFLKALPILFIIYLPFIVWDSRHHPAVQVMFIPILFLIYAGTYTAMRYKLSHITWRGIRGRLAGSALKFASLKMGYAALGAITLGIAIPYSDINTQRYRIVHTYFGSAKAEFHGTASALMKTNIITLLLAIPTLSISRFWYRAALMRYSYASTTIDTLRFEGSQTGGNLLGLFAGNLLLLVLTAGLGMPIIIQRSMRYFADTVTITGDIATADIHQSEESPQRSGEGIYGLLADQDIGFL